MPWLACRVDEDDFGGHGDLMSEGMPSCFASFMVRAEASSAALTNPARHISNVVLLYLQLEQQHVLNPAAMPHAK